MGQEFRRKTKIRFLTLFCRIPIKISGTGLDVSYTFVKGTVDKPWDLIIRVEPEFEKVAIF